MEVRPRTMPPRIGHRVPQTRLRPDAISDIQFNVEPENLEEDLEGNGPNSPSYFYGLMRQAVEVHQREVHELAQLRHRAVELEGRLQAALDGALRLERKVSADSNGNSEVSESALPVKSKSCENLLFPLEGTSSAASAWRSRSFANYKPHYPLMPVWDRSVPLQRLHSASPVRSTQYATSDSQDGIRPEPAQAYKRYMRHFISFPGSPARLTWDFFGAFLIFYDLIAIPMEFFNPPQTWYVEAIDWFTLLFWTANIFASFCVGYVHEGLTVMSPLKIALKYFRTWFIVDLVVVVPDWVFTVIRLRAKEGGGGGGGAESSVKLVRMVRLLRLMKLRKILQTINEMIDTEYLSIIVNILKMIMLLLVINHYVGCIWFLIGSNSTDGDDSWIKYHEFDGAGWTYQYFTSFHWAITQFTPASMHIQPQNVPERVFAIAVVVFALVGFSYVVGSITGSLTQLRSMQEDTTKQFWNLRRYLKQNKVPLTLASRIQRYLEHAWQSQQENISLQNIKIMKLLSEQLHCELQCELSVPHLSVHPLFRRLYDVSNVTMHRLANTAIRRKPLARNDILFISGEKATNMYIVVAGRLQYHKSDSSGDDHHEWVDKGEDWIAEPVLWTPMWLHLGNLTAVTECDLLLVDPKSFSEVFVLNPHAYTLASNYAQRFLMWLESLGADSLTDICQGEEVGPLVESFIDSYTEPMSQTCSSQSATSQHDTWAGRVPSASRRKAVMFWRRGGTC